MPFSKQAYQEGKEAYKEGKVLAECPYPLDSSRAQAWIKGFWNSYKAKEKQEEHSNG